MRCRAAERNRVWSCDFLAECTDDGWQLKIQAVVEALPREYLSLEAVRSLMSRDVMLALQYLVVMRGVPQCLRRDNGPVFAAEDIQHWLNRAEFNTRYSKRGSPWEKGDVEWFDGKL